MAGGAVVASVRLRCYLCYRGQVVVSKSGHFANTHRWRQVKKMRDFRIVDNKYLLKSLTLDKETIQVRIMINQT
ncbi:MAG: hypothetical protein ACKO96_34830, partial [Flammeovirgaceae bacterium]